MLCGRAMSVTSSLVLGARQLVVTSRLLGRSSAPLMTGPIRTLASKRVKGQQKDQPKVNKPKTSKQEVEIQRTMTAAQLAHAMNKDFAHLQEALLNTSVDVDALRPESVLEERWIKEVVILSGMKFRSAQLSKQREKPSRDARPRPPADPSVLVCRPPVVTIMGHVDHGKTTLLDRLRESQIAAGEAGGITQHIGAFMVQLPSGEQITFLDTPGHAAFSSMRARGAGATDIVILVVAADDGVMNQTVESIQHAKRANVPIIVAINKCDKPLSDPDKVKRELLAHDIVCEEFGGDVQAIHISALKGDNLLALAEATVALAEVLELKAEPSGAVEGVVIESHVDKGKGPVTTAIVQRGALRKGAVLVAGRCWAKVRFLFDEHGRVIQGAGPSAAVQIVGWKDLPSAGEAILEVESEQRAREVVEWRCEEEEQRGLQVEQRIIQEKQQLHLQAYRQERAELSHLSWRRRKAELYRTNKAQFAMRPSERTASQENSLRLILKGDVDGSLETLLNVVQTYDSHAQCALQLVSFGLGDVSDNDVNMAEAFSGSIYGFNVSVSKTIRQQTDRRGVPLHLHNVIYKLVDQLKDDINARLPPLLTRQMVGHAAVVSVFYVTVGKKKVPVAGCRVQRGQLDRRLIFRVTRGEELLWEGSLAALKHHRDDVQTVGAGMECGVSVEGNVAFEPGDSVECWQEEEEPQSTCWDPGF